VEPSYTLTYLLTYLLSHSLTHSFTHSMEHSSSWETNRFSTSQEISRILYNPKIRDRVNKCPPTVPVLSQISPVHSTHSHFRKIHFNFVLPLMLWTSKVYLSLRFPHQNPVTTSHPHKCYMSRLISFFSIWSPEYYLVRITDH